MTIQILLGILLFTSIVISLVFIILFARSKLVSSGNVTLSINKEREIEVPVGGKLLNALSDSGLFIASACGGGGTCAQCKVKIFDGGGSLLPAEESHINKREASHGDRLACQVNVKQDMVIEVPEEQEPHGTLDDQVDHALGHGSKLVLWIWGVSECAKADSVAQRFPA